MTIPYNPLEKGNLGRTVAEALLVQDPVRIDELKTFEGAGIYAIYYVGDFKPYESISARNKNGRFEAPIYVGEAVPPGSRKGRMGLDDKPNRSLSSRLRQHAGSIGKSANLNIEDFYCRYLIVDEIWISLGEALLIARYSPIWNHLIDGFGNHTPGREGSGRNVLDGTLCIPVETGRRSVSQETRQLLRLRESFPRS